MKQYIVILSSLLLLSACKTVKKLESATVTVSDSSTVQAAQHTRDSFISKTERIERDTTISIASKTAADTVKLTNSKQPQKFQKQVNGLTIYASVDTAGILSYGCTSDSLLLVVKNLVSEKVFLSRTSDSLSSVMSSSWYSRTEIFKSYWIKTKTFFGYAWPYLLGVAVLALSIFIYRKLKRQYL